MKILCKCVSICICICVEYVYILYTFMRGLNLCVLVIGASRSKLYLTCSIGQFINIKDSLAAVKKTVADSKAAGPFGIQTGLNRPDLVFYSVQCQTILLVGVNGLIL